jgi:hypothetical protein
MEGLGILIVINLPHLGSFSRVAGLVSPIPLFNNTMNARQGHHVGVTPAHKQQTPSHDQLLSSMTESIFQSPGPDKGKNIFFMFIFRLNVLQ